jgi:hypothetical protein
VGLPEGFSVVWVNRYRLPAGYVRRWRGKEAAAPRYGWKNLVCLKTLAIIFQFAQVTVFFALLAWLRPSETA